MKSPSVFSQISMTQKSASRSNTRLENNQVRSCHLDSPLPSQVSSISSFSSASQRIFAVETFRFLSSAPFLVSGLKGDNVPFNARGICAQVSPFFIYSFIFVYSFVYLSFQDCQLEAAASLSQPKKTPQSASQRTQPACWRHQLAFGGLSKPN